MSHEEALFDYVIRQADNCLILGQRLGEWCGHGPVLEQDVAMTNIALDLIGQSRSLYQYAAKLKGGDSTEDDLAYLRDVLQFKNVLLVEQPNGDFAMTVARQFFFDAFHFYFLKDLSQSRDKQISAIAAKSLKEATYHLRWSRDWILRLGDGTEESHGRIQDAVDELWRFTGELFEKNETDRVMEEAGIGVDLEKLRPAWDKVVNETLNEATLEKPQSEWMQMGGKNGSHTEHLGYILADLQFMQRAYPGAKW